MAGQPERDSELRLAPLRCVFEPAIQSASASCELASKHALVEREVISCSKAVAHINCTTLMALFRERARFALRLPGPQQPLPHAAHMRLQCGGLAGLQATLGAPKPDIHALTIQAQAGGASLLELDWAHIVAAMQTWQPRRRGSVRDN